MLKKLCTILTAVMVFTGSAKASDKPNIPVYDGEEIVVIAKAGSTNYQIQRVETPETFEKSIHLQQTAPGLSSPYLGAFTGNQINQNINGICVSNSLYRSGPNQYYSWVPSEFTEFVSVSDGGNVGGSVSRELSVAPSHIGISYDSSNKGLTTSVSYKNEKFGIAVSNIGTQNIVTANGEIPHSSYNQIGCMIELNENLNNKTMLMVTQSKDLDRTDKWNGGWKSSGYQKPVVYTWELQKYLFLNHHFTNNRYDIDVAFQNNTENILDSTTKVRTKLNAYTFNGSYEIVDNILCLYSTNTIENIYYDNGKTKPTDSDSYVTTKQGIRYENIVFGMKTNLSGGLKQVKVTGFESFDSFEGSAIFGYRGFFAGVDYSTHEPGYAMLKQSATTGKGTSLPNPDLTNESATTYRIGYMNKGFYIDGYKKEFSDALTIITVAKDTYKPYNVGNATVYGSTVGYTTRSFFNTHIGLECRAEITDGMIDIVGSSKREPIAKTSPYILYIKGDYKGAFIEWQYSPKDDSLAAADYDDVRIYDYNKGYSVVNIGYKGEYKHIGYSMSIQNIFNNDGRILGSSVDVLERGLIASLNYNL